MALDLLRAYAGPSLAPAQWAAGAAAVVALWSVLGERDLRPRERLPWVALAAMLVPTYVGHARRLDLGDSIHYYAYLRSLLFDHDLDLANDYTLLGWYPQTDVLPVGAPLLWSPLVVLVHLGRHAARLFGLGPPTGTEPLYQAAVCQATLLYGTAGLFLLMHTLRRWVGPAAAFWATVIAWVGSPVRFYLSVLPGLAHGVEFFAAVLVLRAYLALRERPDRRHALLAGAACGLVFLTRSQDGLLLGLPAIELAYRFSLDRRGWPPQALVRSFAVLLIAFVVVALPQIAVWQAMFGTPLLVPHERLHGTSFLHLDHPQLLGTLVSARGGLFASYPMMLVAVLGLLALAFRDPRYVLACAPVVVAGWYVNSVVFDWYQVRRFTGAVPLLAPGLAVVLAPVTRAGVAVCALVAFLVLRYDVAVDALRSTPGDPAPLRAVVAQAADGLAASGYELVAGVSPRAATRLLATYTGQPLLEDEVTTVDLGGETSLLRLPRPARHLSAPAVEDGIACRWVNDREARLFLPLAREGAIVVTLRARALETPEPQFMAVSWNEADVGRVEMSPAWADYRFHVPAAAVVAGTNVLVLRFDRGPVYHRVRGEGPREVRPAALSTLTLHRQH
ncbi:MAG: hypothetical protein DMF83_23145 [Acidobacteria bacterium]|nr:MAG: hypothetical protein DMF83_23145 [Acidobacteriota bacterium]